MAETAPYLVMTDAQAKALREGTKGDGVRLGPVLIRGGSQAGKYALRQDILFRPEFEEWQQTLSAMPVVSLDKDVAWPPEPEETLSTETTISTTLASTAGRVTIG